ncbi:MAG TPA: sigma-70 family RNA polymerase sigma factor [Thermodesulfobacteriota bacterium]|nr:sigma-70 family RNA polymerase sigma factor [Thermodesulfobacteriota bacterium]
MISRCQQGDPEALKEIFNKYHKKVYGIAYGVVRQREEALDIVQEVFIKLFRSIKNFKGRSQFYTYLYRMVMNTAIDHARKAGKQFVSSLDEEGSFEPSDTAERGPERMLLQKELEGRVKLAMDRLPPEQRAALIFRDVEGLSYQEMSEAMGCSIGTVMSRLHYGRRRVQELLKDYVDLHGRSRETSTISKRRYPPKP